MQFFQWDTVECVYEENTNDKRYLHRFPSRKHCLTTLPHGLIFGKFTASNFRKCSEIFESFQKLLKISQTVFEELLLLKNLEKFSENFRNGSKQFLGDFTIFEKFRKIFRNLRKYSEIIGHDGNCSETFTIVEKFRS